MFDCLTWDHLKSSESNRKIILFQLFANKICLQNFIFLFKRCTHYEALSLLYSLEQIVIQI